MTVSYVMNEHFLLHCGGFAGDRGRFLKPQKELKSGYMNLTFS